MELVNREYWVEVRPLITSELNTGNFAPILDALYNLAKPYRFLIKDTGNRGCEASSLIRFYLQLADEQTKNQIANIIRTLIDVEVVSAEPPEQCYQFRAELELAKNYALPIVSYQEKKPPNLIDRLVASIAGSNTSLEITAQADPNALLSIQKYIFEKTNQTPNLNKELLNQSIDAVGTIAKRNLKTKPAKNVSPYNNSDPWVRECTKNAAIKLASTLFICQIVIQSNSAQTAQAIKKALPASAMNHFKTVKKQKNPHLPQTTLKSPSNHWLRNNIFCRLWWITPIAVLLLIYQLGLFDPIKFITSPLSKMEFWPPLLAASLAVGLCLTLRKRHPIVLSTQELAQIIGLPSAIEKLPIALGKVPLSRMQLGTQQTNPNQTKQPQNKKEKPNQKNNHPPNHQQHHNHHQHGLPSALENKGLPAVETEQK
ncbi:hypothetical protein [Candidatus Bathycorpusculum sp.]|jgi:hypothetical protein|uniref:hypothetical protein n=1 Tax=Candidatus Bathycorpusculum sp. TaxID=2994959 RepID=UPI0028262D26|nr:hypothetical protein [Candidatus Termitimicrobium sp.]MCL2686416.1 hypothetical protein [Candidatus Termitimicrobium sp.]